MREISCTFGLTMISMWRKCFSTTSFILPILTHRLFVLNILTNNTISHYNKLIIHYDASSGLIQPVDRLHHIIYARWQHASQSWSWVYLQPPFWERGNSL